MLQLQYLSLCHFFPNAQMAVMFLKYKTITLQKLPVLWDQKALLAPQNCVEMEVGSMLVAILKSLKNVIL